MPIDQWWPGPALGAGAQPLNPGFMPPPPVIYSVDAQLIGVLERIAAPLEAMAKAQR